MWINWAPTKEKTRLIAFGFSGGNIGNVIGLPLGGYLCTYGFDGGWSSIFYTFGIKFFAIGVSYFLFKFCH
jgi:MFS transporter, ACS family, solute carrier family 17 (sodium-dependent inorganic phosphate cotransporter), member 5